jgi:hypothetical protein
VSICAFVFISEVPKLSRQIPFFDLGYLGNGKVQDDRFRRGLNGESPYAAHFRSYEDFNALPGKIFAFQLSKRQIDCFKTFQPLGDWSPIKQGLATGKNESFVRTWSEVSYSKIGLGFASASESAASKKKWFPYNKGGDFRRWYGNNYHVVNWEFDGRQIKNFGADTGKVRSRAQNTEFYFRPSVTWSFISSSNFGARFSPKVRFLMSQEVLRFRDLKS